MGDILNRTVDRAVKLNFIPQSERDVVIKKIEQISSKYGVSGDDFALFSMMETEGLNPKSTNPYGCAGIIQFCPGGGLSSTGLSTQQMASLSVLQQLDYVDKYFEENNLQKGSQLADLYLTVLNPNSRSTKGLDDDLRIPSLGAQASALKTSTGIITRRSLEAGIRKIAAEKLGGPITASDPALVNEGTLPGDYRGQTAVGTTGLISGVFTSSCTEPFPISFNLTEALTYAGCKIKLSAAQIAGSAFGLGAPASASLGANNTVASLGGGPYTGPLAPGGYINPCPKAIQSAPFGQNRGDHIHGGIDLAAPIGTPIYASADGKVIRAATSGISGFEAAVVLEHGNGNQTVYGHVNAIYVQEGQDVKQGDHIADVGNKGRSSGAHLHFEIHVNSNGAFTGHKIDPAPLIRTGTRVT